MGRSYCLRLTAVHLLHEGHKLLCGRTRPNYPKKCKILKHQNLQLDVQLEIKIAISQNPMSIPAQPLQASLVVVPTVHSLVCIVVTQLEMSVSCAIMIYHGDILSEGLPALPPNNYGAIMTWNPTYRQLSLLRNGDGKLPFSICLFHAI